MSPAAQLARELRGHARTGGWIACCPAHRDRTPSLLDWLAADWPGRPLLSVPDLYTFGPGPVRDKQTASRIIGILQDHGWLVREDGPAKVNGTVRREVWRLVHGAVR